MNLERLYHQHVKRLYERINRQVKDSEMAMDIVQDAFVQVLQHEARHQPKEIENEAGYMHRVAANELASFRRTKKNFVAWTASDEDPETLEHNRCPETICEQRQQVEVIQEVVDNMPERTQQVFELCRLEGKTYDEAAAILSISKSSVQKHLRKALDLITDALE